MCASRCFAADCSADTALADSVSCPLRDCTRASRDAALAVSWSLSRRSAALSCPVDVTRAYRTQQQPQLNGTNLGIHSRHRAHMHRICTHLGISQLIRQSGHIALGRCELGSLRGNGAVSSCQQLLQSVNLHTQPQCLRLPVSTRKQPMKQCSNNKNTASSTMYLW